MFSFLGICWSENAFTLLECFGPNNSVIILNNLVVLSRYQSLACDYQSKSCPGMGRIVSGCLVSEIAACNTDEFPSMALRLFWFGVKVEWLTDSEFLIAYSAFCIILCGLLFLEAMITKIKILINFRKR